MARAILIVKAVGVGLGRTRGVVCQKNGRDIQKILLFWGFLPWGLGGMLAVS
jgi:hypothetical protein